MHLSHVWFIGFIATFLGVGIGGILSYFVNGFKRSISTVYAVCAGLILGLISFGIVPEAIALGNWSVLLLGFITGLFLFKFIHKMFATRIHNRPDLQSGLLLMIIISFHNFPIGVILGAGDAPDLGKSLLLTLVLHNIPEGMILFTLLFIARFRFFLLLFLSFVVAVPVAVGAVIGIMIGMQNTNLWAFLMSLTVGTIYMVTVKEILPESVIHSSNAYSMFIAVISFFLIGAYLLYL